MLLHCCNVESLETKKNKTNKRTNNPIKWKPTAIVQPNLFRQEKNLLFTQKQKNKKKTIKKPRKKIVRRRGYKRTAFLSALI